MKSNVCVIKKGGIGLKAILNETEKICAYNELDKQSALRLRLLAEELTGMLSELLQNFEGSFFCENNGNKYELHVEVSVPNMSKELKENIISVSKNKKNASAKGIMGRIREAAQNMMLTIDETPEASTSMIDWHMADADYYYTYSWTLNAYKSQTLADQDTEAWDELERSIVAKLADDVIVGVKGRCIEIIIKKEF